MSFTKVDIVLKIDSPKRTTPAHILRTLQSGLNAVPNLNLPGLIIYYLRYFVYCICIIIYTLHFINRLPFMGHFCPQIAGATRGGQIQGYSSQL